MTEMYERILSLAMLQKFWDTDSWGLLLEDIEIEVKNNS